MRQLRPLVGFIAAVFVGFFVGTAGAQIPGAPWNAMGIQQWLDSSSRDWQVGYVQGAVDALAFLQSNPPTSTGPMRQLWMLERRCLDAIGPSVLFLAADQAASSQELRAQVQSAPTFNAAAIFLAGFGQCGEQMASK